MSAQPWEKKGCGCHPVKQAVTPALSKSATQDTKPHANKAGRGETVREEGRKEGRKERRRGEVRMDGGMEEKEEGKGEVREDGGKEERGGGEEK